MQVTKIIKFIFLPVALLSMNAFSSEKFVGIDYKYLNYNPVGVHEKISAAAINLEFLFNEYYSTEIYVGSGLNKVNLESELSEIEVDIGLLWGISFKAQYPVSDRFSLYAKAGYNEVTGRAEALDYNISSTDTESDQLYGLGFSFEIKKNNQLYIEYASYIHDSQIEFDGVSIGYKYKI
ncbi:outer membrane beta-barrel protein [Teredinibacter turnerae]|uniref:outer membrane beta-barrel protein n=1 Tax=Teredinibacter turnerae TaxID=2426 RepID=UPI000374F2AA|nr:outer membrane beta-barrel protein [Teredinibacter turnerae]